MSAYASVLTDTLSVLSFVAGSGKIDAATRKSAQAYLGQVDMGWQAANPIDATATLYLDDLAVTYLDHTGVLNALTRSVAATYVHGDLDMRTREVLRHGKHAEALLSAIERIRSTIGARAEAGYISFSARHVADENNADGEAGAIFDLTPTLDLMADLSGLDAVIADDRCLNKVPSWTDGSGRNAPSGTVIDVLAALRKAGQIDEEAYLASAPPIARSGILCGSFGIGRTAASFVGRARHGWKAP